MPRRAHRWQTRGRAWCRTNRRVCRAGSEGPDSGFAARLSGGDDEAIEAIGNEVAVLVRQQAGRRVGGVADVAPPDQDRLAADQPYPFGRCRRQLERDPQEVGQDTRVRS